MVDAGHRRRGYARRLLARCHTEIASFHRSHAVLDVLTHNAPARILYLSEGYRPLRSSSLYVLPLVAPASSAPPSPDARLRPYRRSDRRALSAIAQSAVPPEIARVLPPAGRRLVPSPSEEQLFSSESSSWVLEEDGKPTAWVSAISSKYMEAASLATPIVDPHADPAGVHAMLSVAIDWCRHHRAERVICRVPDDNPVSGRAIGAEGFTSTLTFDTLCHPLP